MNMGSGQLAVPPGFRFHPTDEELLYYYLRKKVSYEPIDLDVIREVDLNKLEPWDLKEKCRIGSGPQNEWYFFSHKDKKYPTGTRTNRATAAGFWKATGRDKAIHMADSKRIGMRKTLVFYTGRAPHGHKTDWIMHEYRLDDNQDAHQSIQEDGWVVCRVFKKKSHIRGGGGGGYQLDIASNINTNAQMEDFSFANMKASGSSSLLHHHQYDDHHQPKHHHHHQPLYHHDHNNYPFDASMHLPQLFSPDSNPVVVASSSYAPPLSLAMQDIDCSQSLLRLTSNTLAPAPEINHPAGRQFHGGAGDWTFLDKLLASSGNSNGHALSKCNPSSSADHLHLHGHDHQDHVALGNGSTPRLFPFQYLGCDTADMLKFSK